MSASSLSITIEAIDRFSKTLGAAGKSIQQLTQFAAQGSIAVGQAMHRAGQSVSSLGQSMTDKVTRPVAAGLTHVAKSAIEVQSALADVGKVANLELGSEKLEEIKKEAQLLTRTIPMSTTEMLSLIEAGAQLGVPQEMLTDFAESAAIMGTSFDIEASRAGGSMARLMNTFGLGLDGVTLMGDAINHLSNNSATSAAQLVEITSRAGGVARTFGLSAAQTSAVAAAFGEFSPNAESAATAMNSVLPLLSTASKGTTAFKRGLAAAGFEASDFERTIQQDASGALKAFIGQLGSMDSLARSAAIKDMFGTGIDAQVVTTLAENAEELEKAFGLVSDEAEFAGSMQGEFNTKASTAENQIKLMRNALGELSENIGASLTSALDKVVPKITEFINKLAEFFSQNPDILASIATSIGEAILPALEKGIPLVESFLTKFANFAESNPGLLRIAGMLAAVLVVAGPVLIALGAVISSVGTIFTVIGGAIGVIGFALGFLLSPVGLIVLAVVAVAAAAFLIIKYWEPIKAFFVGVWDAVKAALAGFMAMLGQKFQSAAILIVKLWEPIKAFFAQLWEGVKVVFASAKAFIVQTASEMKARFGAFLASLGMKIQNVSDTILNTLQNLISQAFSAGASIVGSIANGIRSAIGRVRDAAGAVGAAIRNFLPGSPVKVGPLTALNNIASNPGAEIVNMLARGVQAAVPALQNAMGNVGVTATLGNPVLDRGIGVPSDTDVADRSNASPIASPIVSPVVSPISVNINISGVSSVGDAEGVAGVFEERVRQVLQDHQRNQMRVSYG